MDAALLQLAGGGIARGACQCNLGVGRIESGLQRQQLVLTDVALGAQAATALGALGGQRESGLRGLELGLGLLQSEPGIALVQAEQQPAALDLTTGFDVDRADRR
jgi:hypothetical protein